MRIDQCLSYTCMHVYHMCTDLDSYGRPRHLEQRGYRHGRHQQGRAAGPCSTTRWYDI